MKHIPNLFTLLNLVVGCVAIILILQTESIIIYTDESFASSFNIPESLVWGCLLLFAAALVDFLDGFVARLFKATSAMGAQLDSLADVVSFGAAPGIILYQLLRFGFMRDENGLDTPFWYLLPVLIVPAAAAYRLARFNLDHSHRIGFQGLPTPAAGLLVASLPLIIHFGQPFPVMNSWLVMPAVIYGLAILLSWLMISKIPLIALKFKGFGFMENLPAYTLIASGVIAVAFLYWLAVPFLFVVYIGLSLILKKRTHA